MNWDTQFVWICKINYINNGKFDKKKAAEPATNKKIG